MYNKYYIIQYKEDIMSSVKELNLDTTQLQLFKFKLEYSRLNILSDDIYQKILTYIFTPKVHLSRWNSITHTWNIDLFISRCYLCKRSAKTVALSHTCGCGGFSIYISDYTHMVCTNELICWDCAH